jgi:predicted transcriptional regulator
MPVPQPHALTRREREIMNALFALGNRATAEAIRSRLIKPPSSSATRTMLARLEAKGHVRHDQDGVRYIYAATTSRTKAQRAALKHYVQTFFDGSVGRMVATLLRQESWTEKELEAVRAAIAQARAERDSS